MFSLFKDNYNLFRNNMVLVQPLLLFFIISGFITMIPGEIVDPLKLIIIMLCVGLMWIVFYSGWFNMLKSCVKRTLADSLSKPELYFESLKLFKEFFPGVALYFVPLLFASMLYLVVISMISIFILQYGVHSIGIPLDFSIEKLLEHNRSDVELSNYIFSLPEATKLIIVKWEILFISFMLLISTLGYFTMFWWQNIVYFDDGIFKSLLRSLKFIITSPIKTFLINIAFAFFLFIAFFIAVIPFIVFQFLGMIAYIMVFVYFNLLLFKYIDSKNNSNIRPDSIGQD